MKLTFAYRGAMANLVSPLNQTKYDLAAYKASPTATTYSTLFGNINIPSSGTKARASVAVSACSISNSTATSMASIQQSSTLLADKATAVLAVLPEHQAAAGLMQLSILGAAQFAPNASAAATAIEQQYVVLGSPPSQVSGLGVWCGVVRCGLRGGLIW